MAAVGITMGGCSDEADSIYSNESAFLKFTPVTAVAPLYTALNSSGMFCTIQAGTSAFTFQGSDGQSASYPLTAVVTNYGRPNNIAGFIVGTPSVPDLSGQTGPVAFDLVCSNCYESSLITRRLTLASDERALCEKCGRTYNLQSGLGEVVEGDKGSRLYRYRMTYTQNILLIMN